MRPVYTLNHCFDYFTHSGKDVKISPFNLQIRVRASLWEMLLEVLVTLQTVTSESAKYMDLLLLREARVYSKRSFVLKHMHSSRP